MLQLLRSFLESLHHGLAFVMRFHITLSLIV
jgi:hypothetical protein